MFSFIGSLLSSSLARNLINRYTSSGYACILIGFLEGQGILPSDTLDRVNGVPAKELLSSILFVVGMYLISHLHIVGFIRYLGHRKLAKIHEALDIEQTKLEIKKAQLENLQLDKQIKNETNNDKK